VARQDGNASVTSPLRLHLVHSELVDLVAEHTRIMVSVDGVTAGQRFHVTMDLLGAATP
jgi:hypothetical protein